ncbi:acyl-CoA dehydrogenase family protein [Streptomyces sp. ISL-11]|uniref:acyl-CoA dehydrogenase family protein n=1 Tax=Streptomyces sp. ISL-11 TaxID=2819174 RepID=UPI001BEB60E2|nr:acyl-CoA dehydrogenase family protein [Streptomyces sp. ISL-11]MBT2382947.1 acyl-CoA dehydrogenase family protein [Streptomyces sp. ISL-11]
MAQRTRNLISEPDRPSFLEELYQGRFRWDLLHPFPEQDAADKARGDEAVAALGAFLRERVDPAAVEAEGRLPDGLFAELRSHGYLGLQLGPDLGGLGLSHFNTFRVIEAAAGWCFPVALVMGIENSVGAPAFLPVVPDGPLKELLHKHVVGGGLSGTADTEPEGAANQRRFTSAEPVDGGAAYVLNGHKVFVGHAPVGSLFSVTASVVEDGAERNRVFFVEAGTPGFGNGAWQEFSGIRGFPNGWITLDNVRVPAGHQLVEAEGEHRSRLTPAVSRLVVRGRLHMIVAPSLAVAKLCLRWSRDFINRRTIDDCPLGEYEEIRRQLAESLSETFAIESVARAALLSEDLGLPRNLAFEQNAAKNIGSVTAGRIADRTMSVLAAEGYETARSKARRGAPALPLEQAVRDVRNMRISGGVDFQIDNWIAGRGILSYYYPEPDHAAGLEAGPSPVVDPRDAVLTVRNRAHLDAVAEAVHRFGRTCLDLARRHPDKADLIARQRVIVLLSGITSELLAMSACLARASRMSAVAGDDGDGDGQRLADLYCTTARHRLAGLWHRLDHAASGEGDDDADFAGMSSAWLAADGPHHLSDDLVAEADAAAPAGH